MIDLWYNQTIHGIRVKSKNSKITHIAKLRSHETYNSTHDYMDHKRVHKLIVINHF